MWNGNGPRWSQVYCYKSSYSERSITHPYAFYLLDEPEEDDTMGEWPMSLSSESLRDELGSEELDEPRTPSESHLEHDQDVTPDHMNGR